MYIYKSTQRQKDTNYFSGLIFFWSVIFFSDPGYFRSWTKNVHAWTKFVHHCMYREYGVIQWCLYIPGQSGTTVTTVTKDKSETIRNYPKPEDVTFNVTPTQRHFIPGF